VTYIIQQAVTRGIGQPRFIGHPDFLDSHQNTPKIILFSFRLIIIAGQPGHEKINFPALPGAGKYIATPIEIVLYTDVKNNCAVENLTKW
jgi:hypothetical protein